MVGGKELCRPMLLRDHSISKSPRRLVPVTRYRRGPSSQMSDRDHSRGVPNIEASKERQRFLNGDDLEEANDISKVTKVM